MLKGHLQIELKNEETGEVETHEQTNMVTNALSNVLGICANASYSSSTYLIPNLLPVSKRGLGGLFLFDGTLEESEDNIHFPMDVHLVGTAGQVAKTNSKITGSINNNESMKLENGYTNVWDFSTSQANGTIASLALTNYKAGEDPFDSVFEYSNNFTMNNSYVPMAYDQSSGTAYFLYSGKIYSKKIYSHRITVNSPNHGEEIEVKNLNLSNPGSSSWTINNGYDGYVYAIYMPSVNNKGSVAVRIKKYRISDFSFEEESEQSFTLENITSGSSSSPSYYLNYTIVVSKGYLYFLSYSKDILYQVNLSNVADIKELKFGVATVVYIYPRYNGGLYGKFIWKGTSSSGSTVTYYGSGYIYSDGKYIYKEESTSTPYNGYGNLFYSICFEGNDLVALNNYNGNNLKYAFMTNYLGTICNLDSPVVKTSAQTMKVTYTLTDE